MTTTPVPNALSEAGMAPQETAMQLLDHVETTQSPTVLRSWVGILLCNWPPIPRNIWVNVWTRKDERRNCRRM
jgi:hypothetical protein